MRKNQLWPYQREIEIPIKNQSRDMFSSYVSFYAFVSFLRGLHGCQKSYRKKLSPTKTNTFIYVCIICNDMWCNKKKRNNTAEKNEFRDGVGFFLFVITNSCLRPIIVCFCHRMISMISQLTKYYVWTVQRTSRKMLSFARTHTKQIKYFNFVPYA